MLHVPGKKKLSAALRKVSNPLLRKFGHEIIRSIDLVDYYLHEYPSYEEYRRVQTFYNKQKIRHVWADESTLQRVSDELVSLLGKPTLRGICHGSRNGFEQTFFRERCGHDAIGTDISDTAGQFDNTVQWDFHDKNPKWVGQFDFVYSNSLDQGWNPRVALVSWLNQLNKNGLLVIEHTEGHGPRAASEMDPFGVRPKVMPYVLCDWFGFDISVKIVESLKGNSGKKVWLLFVKKNVATII